METTTDAFLGGRIDLCQPAKGYRAGADPVFLAASVPATSGQTVLDLGCGVGAAMFCLAARVPHVSLTGIEVQDDYATLAQKNAQNNGFTADIRTADIVNLPADVRNQTYDHVIANPPYFKSGHGAASENTGKNTAFRAEVPLSKWVEVGMKRTAPKGHLSIIQRMERLPEILAPQVGAMGDIHVIPITARAGRRPHLVIVRSRKNSKGDFIMCSPVALHDGDVHQKDGDSYRDEIKTVLRDGAAFPICC